MRRDSAQPGSSVTPPVLKLIASAMATALLALVVISLVLRPATGGGLPSTVVWILGGLGLANLLVGTILAVTSDSAAPGYRTRILVSLALRDAAGLLGAVPTLLGADPAWALGLGGAAIVSILALLPREPSRG